MTETDNLTNKDFNSTWIGLRTEIQRTNNDSSTHKSNLVHKKYCIFRDMDVVHWPAGRPPTRCSRRFCSGVKVGLSH
jgi:hypothetical protein